MTPKKSTRRIKQTDLHVTEGDPSAAADEAYARQKSDIVLRASVLSGRFEARFSGPDSPLQTVMVLLLILLGGFVPALLFDFLGFNHVVSGASATVTWVAAVVITLVRHRRQ